MSETQTSNHANMARLKKMIKSRDLENDKLKEEGKELLDIDKSNREIIEGLKKDNEKLKKENQKLEDNKNNKKAKKVKEVKESLGVVSEDLKIVLAPVVGKVISAEPVLEPILNESQELLGLNKDETIDMPIASDKVEEIIKKD